MGMLEPPTAQQPDDAQRSDASLADDIDGEILIPFVDGLRQGTGGIRPSPRHGNGVAFTSLPNVDHTGGGVLVCQDTL
jgi:hypothetical protein